MAFGGFGYRLGGEKSHLLSLPRVEADSTALRLSDVPKGDLFTVQLPQPWLMRLVVFPNANPARIVLAPSGSESIRVRACSVAK